VNNPRTFLLQVCPSLLEAAKSGDVNTAKVLLKCSDSRCSDYDIHRSTPLTHAAGYGHVDVVRVLLEEGANVNRANGTTCTALHQAAWNGHLDVCRLLLDWGAKVDAWDKLRISPLHVAAERVHLTVVKLLVHMGANVSLKDKWGKTASDVARNREKKVVAEWLDTVRRG
jgi:ankyrin repeat protein